jgi:hypothetical protein
VCGVGRIAERSVQNGVHATNASERASLLTDKHHFAISEQSVHNMLHLHRSRLRGVRREKAWTLNSGRLLTVRARLRMTGFDDTEGGRL